MAEHHPAPSVAVIALDLIGSTHTRLVDVPIVYVFRSSAQISKGRIVLAKARKISGLNAFLAAMASGDLEQHPEFGHSFFCMEVAGDQWLLLDEAQRVALVDHELCHFDVEYNEEGLRELTIRGHDVEEFVEVVRRHGAWDAALEAMVSSCLVPR